jgi:hypothetical protein
MADLNVTAGSVAPVTSGSAPTVTARGIAGENIAPGRVVYADPSSNNLIRLADAQHQDRAVNVVGIALGSAALNQPITYAVSGDVSLPSTGAGSQLMSGSVYILSANTGGSIVSTADAFTADNFVTVLGIGNGTATATATNTFRLAIIPAAAQKI